MSTIITEQEIHPLVPENVSQNDKTIAYVRNMTSPMFGVVAGTLGLTSWFGFAFYGLSSLFVSGLVFVFLTRGQPAKYVQPAWSVWTMQVLAGVPSYLLTWTLFYGLVHVYD